ncbi:MAG: hypothetical protein Ct9H90mP30_4960 [Actinomycetota bacterium]|nr:MAG: hypothetical protein Ct9H90mP30_4960 [Actinomycetota bacterium]
MEAAAGGVKFIVAVTEGVPAHDEAIFYNHSNVTIPMSTSWTQLSGEIISPGKCNIGITAGHIANLADP